MLVSYAGFVGPSNKLRATVADNEITRNWFVEPIAPGTGPGGFQGYLKPTPGIQPFTVLSKGPLRQLWHQNGRTFAVAGNGFYEVFANHTNMLRGLVAVDSKPASISSNGSAGNQVFVVSGNYGYIFNLSTNTLTQIGDSEFPFPCTMGAFIDGYFLALKGRTNQFQWSALEDGLTWDGLDVAQLSQTSDFIQSITNVHGQLSILGTQTSVVWADTGGSSAFEPIPGSLGMQGSAGAWSAAVLDNTLCWVGSNEQGHAVVYRMNGYTPQRISTHAVETALQNCQRLSDVIAWTFQMDGHAFYCLYIPSADCQWVYDASTSLWFQWSIWNTTTLKFEPWVGRCHTFAFGKHLVGDRQSGAIYEMDPSIAQSQLVVMGAA
ncbi:MAG TPA: hypothetical protein VF573_27355 [Paraburkholderia sp.]|uniref:hypothetical protein n=1 Tax=Paraburkholderia sp. TaxID=1926495 RepID=UPI002ED3AAF2